MGGGSQGLLFLSQITVLVALLLGCDNKLKKAEAELSNSQHKLGLALLSSNLSETCSITELESN